MSENMIVVGYVRVSTEHQLDNYSIDEQTERLKAYCRAKGWILVKIYTDGGFSGGNTNRPALQQMLLDIRNHHINSVIVYKLDRLSRSQKDTLRLIEDEFLANNTDFISISENFDTSTPFGRAMIGILSVFAQLEKDQITERLSMGRNARGKSGLFHGGGQAPFGYDYVDGHLQVNPYQALQVQEVFQRFLTGQSINSIHIQMKSLYSGFWSAAKVLNMLRNSIYIGKVKFAQKEYNGVHEAIISDEIYQEVQRLLVSSEREGKKNSAQKTPYRAGYLLSSMVYCGRCGSRYAANHGYYKCYSRSKSNKKYITNPNCKNDNWLIEELDLYVIQAIQDLLGNEKLLAEIIDSCQHNPILPTTDQKKLEQRILEIDKQMSNIIDLYQMVHQDNSDIPIDDIVNRIKQLSIEKRRLESELKNDNKTPDNKRTSFLNTLKNFQDHFHTSPLETQRLIVSGLVESITVDGHQISLKWRI